MKAVVSGNELREKMKTSINMLCDTVKTTLGPKGCNAIITHSTFSPFITNDGVTIAKAIESDDIIINTILEIAKEASIKTNENVGDGTTTTLVLLQSIFNNGIKMIEDGLNPILLKKELDISLSKIKEEIKLKSRKPSDRELEYIACVSANDNEIGKNISDVYFKVKNKSAITIKEGNNYETIINYLKGYRINSILASNYFLKDLKEIEYKKTYLLLINNYLENIEDISNIINEIIIKKENLIILANDYNEYLINEIVSLNIDNNINIVLLKNPEYGVKQISILKDIASISNANILEKTDYVSMNDLGIVEGIKINQDEVVFSFKMNKNIEKRLEILKQELKLIEDEFDLEFFNKRIAMFNYGIASILVGGATTTERREKKMRYDDAMCAISSAENGILPGSGITLLDVSNRMVLETKGDKILKEALKAPFEQIMDNAGIDFKEILKKIESNNYELIYNLNTLEYENIYNTKIIDSTSVVINSLISSISIASMLLTTTSIIVNEYQNNMNKINDYNEI